MCESVRETQVTWGVWSEDDVWGEVGNETGVGLRAPVYKVKELVFYLGGVRKPREVFEQDCHYTGSCVRKSSKGPSLESRAQRGETRLPLPLQSCLFPEVCLDFKQPFLCASLCSWHAFYLLASYMACLCFPFLPHPELHQAGRGAEPSLGPQHRSSWVGHKRVVEEVC